MGSLFEDRFVAIISTFNCVIYVLLSLCPRSFVRNSFPRFHVSSELVCIITVCTYYFPLTYKNVPHSKPTYRCSLPQFASILAREIVRVEDIFLHLEMRSLNLNDMDCHHM